MSTSQSVVKNTAYLYIRTIVSLLVSVFTTRILLQALGVSDFGLYNLIGGVIAMLGFVSSAMSGVTLRFLSYAEGTEDKSKTISYFANSVIIHRILALLMIFILTIVGVCFFNGILNISPEQTEAAIAIYVCTVVSTVFSITIAPYDAAINAHECMLFYSILGILDVLFKFGIAIAVFWLDDNQLVFYAVLMMLESFLLRFITQMYCRKKYEECRHLKLRQQYNRQIVKEMTSFAGWNMANVATGMFSLYGMNVVANHFFGTHINAAMAIATQLSGVIMGISLNMIKAISPVIIKSAGSNRHDNMLKMSYAGCKFSYLLFSFAGIPVIVFLKPILSLWLTVVPDWTWIFCVILLAASLIEQLTLALYQSIIAVGNIRGYMLCRSVVNITPILISVTMYLWHDFSPVWIYINYGIAKSIITGVVNVWYAHLKLGYDVVYFLTKIVIPCSIATLISLCICLACKYCTEIYNVHYVVSLAICFVSSIIIYWSVTLEKSEKSVIKSILSRLNPC